jgi:lon-related putative ATP-dependent protease
MIFKRDKTAGGEKPGSDRVQSSHVLVKAPEHPALPPERLRPAADPARLGFRTTAELEPISGLIGQDRALKAIEFGVNIRQYDFNIFVLGPPSAGKTTAVRAFLEKKAATRSAPMEWVYVNNFDNPMRPRAISLPRGRARKLAREMTDTIDELRTLVPAIMDSEEMQARRKAIEEKVRGEHEQAFEALGEKAQAQGIALVKTPSGLVFAPVQDGKIVPPEVFSTLEEGARRDIETKIQALQKELQEIMERVPKLQRERRQGLRKLMEEVAEVAVRQAIGDVKALFTDVPAVAAHLEEAHKDLVHNVGLFVRQEAGEAEGEGESGEAGSAAPAGLRSVADSARDVRFRRWMVNVIIANGEQDMGAPIVDELNPTHGNLMGRVEHIAQMGTLVTDFLLIRPGALHRANGGYLMIDARKLLLSPYAWEALKRALKAHELRIEGPAEMSGFAATQSLDPDPIPLDIKVVLFGDRDLYYMLAANDPDFHRIFKVQADFDDTIDRTADNDRAYGRLIASIVKRHELKHVDAGGVARMIEEGARLASDNAKLSIEVGRIADIVREADYWASEAKHDVITRADIDSAIKAHIERSDRLRDKSNEGIARGIMLVATEGAEVGQINGLSVLSLGDLSYGRPTRITARVRMGAGRVTDIEREVKLGGPLHSKGVMILWGFLAGRFAQDVPLALAASLVFEQSYGGVDGDSASSTELYALLSALSGVPIKQSFAVTGSVNQLGEVQAIGGVNEKIEGFFDICAARGLTGAQGVLIPQSNVQHLMLREDVVAAVRAGKFRIHGVATIDQGIEILTGVAAGKAGSGGAFPAGTINALVEERLQGFAAMRRSAGGGGGDADDGAAA